MSSVDKYSNKKTNSFNDIPVHHFERPQNAKEFDGFQFLASGCAPESRKCRMESNLKVCKYIDDPRPILTPWIIFLYI